jgi:hypothetical protein
LLQAVRGNKNSHFKLYPTPQAYSKGNSKSMPGITALDIAVRPELAKHAVRARERRMYPTPRSERAGRTVKLYAGTVSGNAHARQANGGHGDLEEEVARDNPELIANGGQLNPTWVEWVMGWPLGWTDLELLETDKFLSWLQLHGVSCHPQLRKGDEKPSIPQESPGLPTSVRKQ